MSPKQVLNISPIFFFQKTDRLAKNGARVTLCFAIFGKKKICKDFHAYSCEFTQGEKNKDL